MSVVALATLAAALAVTHAAQPPALDGDAGWESVPAAQLDWDFTNGRSAREKTAVRLLVDEQYLYVRFDADQREPLAASQNVNDIGQGSDDEVDLALWPSGTNGFKYAFSANPRGTHYQSSSENTTYAPTWVSRGSARAGGYTVTMRIPLRAIRADGRATWLAQFSRTIRATGERDVWEYAGGQQSAEDVSFAGRLEGFGSVARAARTKPRLGVYGLGEAGTRGTGGSTSRTGFDLSLPLSATSSLVATVHPDFSNVEVDQQTIAPTTFRRQYNEVRPFFAQGANFYDYNNCYGCPGASELYTPAIPTPRRGYQLEGKQGQFTFGALDAIGDGRTDDAQSLAYSTPDKRYTWNYTRIASEQRGLHDLVDYGFFSYNDHKRYSAYLEEGLEHGSVISDPAQARRIDGGFAYNTKDDFASFTMRHVGAQYNPADGFVAVGDIAGYSAQASHTWRYGRESRLEQTSASAFVDRYAGSDGLGTNVYDFNLSASAFLKNKLSLGAGIGSSFFRLPGDPTLHPANQQGARLDYLYGTALQSSLSWNTGRFGDGRLANGLVQGSLKLARRATVTLFATDTDWRGLDGSRQVQWLERASATFDLGPRASFSAGVRKLIGTPPPFPFALPYANATNVSFGYAARRPHDDLYLVYGDAGAPTTRPAFTVKLVHYFGAEKGT